MCISDLDCDELVDKIKLSLDFDLSSLVFDVL